MKNVEIIKAKALETGAITPEEVEKYESDDLTIPVKSFIGWKSEDYHINRGEKAAFKAEVWVKARGKFVKVETSYFTADQIAPNKKTHALEVTEFEAAAHGRSIIQVSQEDIKNAYYKLQIEIARVKVQNSLDAMDAISSCTAKKAAKAFTR